MTIRYSICCISPYNRYISPILMVIREYENILMTSCTEFSLTEVIFYNDIIIYLI